MLTVGVRVWLPCKVRPGPFSDERMVLIRERGNEWFGYVNTRWLQVGVGEGNDKVSAKVVQVDGSTGTFTARIPGNAPVPSTVGGDVARAEVAA